MMNILDWKRDAGLLYVVVNPKLSSKVIASAKEKGVAGASVMRGRGTVSSGLLNALGIVDSRKEIVLMAGDMPTVQRTLEELSEQFHFDQPNKGIAFMVRLSGVTGTDVCMDWPVREQHLRDQVSWQLIAVITDEADEDDVLDAAKAAGARGGTIIHAHGSGSRQTTKVFDMEIEPEKSLIFMLVPIGQVLGVEQAIDKAMGLDRPNTGIIFTHNIIGVRGLYQVASNTDSAARYADRADGFPLATANGGSPVAVAEGSNPSEIGERALVSPSHRSIMVVVEKGQALEVIKAAEAAGAPGGTLIQGRGSGVHDTARMFGRVVEPEKEIVLVIAPYEQAEVLVEAIYRHLDMGEPGNGVILLQDIVRAHGLAEVQ